MPARLTSPAVAPILFSLIGAALPGGASAQPAIAVGEPFPDLALPTLDGEVRSLEDYRGTKVVLHVFASW